MAWEGMKAGVTTMLLLVYGASAPAEDGNRPPMAAELGFIAVRTDGGAQLGMPLAGPAKITPSIDASATLLPVQSPMAPALTPGAEAMTTALASTKAPLLTPTARRCDPAHIAMEENRGEVVSRIRRDYFQYLTLLHEADALDAVKRRIDDRDASSQQTSGAKLPPDKAGSLAWQILHKQVESQQRQTQADLAATWGRLSLAVGVPDLPRPMRIADYTLSIPRWALVEIERRVRNGNAMTQANREVQVIRHKLALLRTGSFPSPASLGDALTSLMKGKTASIREAELEYIRAHNNACALELKLIGDAREAWARFQAARDNLNQLKIETLPQLYDRIDLVQHTEQTADAFAVGHDACQPERELFLAVVEQCHTRRELWRAVTDLEALLQVSGDEGIARYNTGR